jgi:hypothetical protein
MRSPRWVGWIRVAGEAFVAVVDADTRDEAAELLGCVPGAGQVERIVLRAGKTPNQENDMTRFERSETV